MARRTKATEAAAAAPSEGAQLAPPAELSPCTAAEVTPLALPAELTIYTVGELHPQWLAWLQQGDAAAPAELQASAVDQVDGAGLQLLLALARAVSQRGRALRIQAPSDVLRAGCAALGLSDWLQGHAEGAAA